MNLIQESFQRLYPQKEFNYQTEMEYNRRLGDFNANILHKPNLIKVNMNLQWKDIDDEIKIGLIQHLLLKIFKGKIKSTQNTDLYNNFLRNIDILAVRDTFDPILEQSFDRINTQFFTNQMQKPNLVWGRNSFRRLASYNFHNDTITMSSIFKDEEQNVLDHIMYHELLHKHFKFEHKEGRSSFHSPAFKRAEREFPNFHENEREISRIIRRKKYQTPKKVQKQSLWRFLPKF